MPDAAGRRGREAGHPGPLGAGTGRRHEGAAVRDGDGRTYAAATVSLPSVSLTALQLAVASAVSSGAATIEAAAVVTEASTLDPARDAAVRDLGPGAPIHLAAPDGSPARPDRL